jgi:hypothetical protein
MVASRGWLLGAADHSSLTRTRIYCYERYYQVKKISYSVFIKIDDYNDVKNKEQQIINNKILKLLHKLCNSVLQDIPNKKI